MKAAPLGDVKVEDVVTEDDHALVSVSYRVGGHAQTAHLVMVADDEHKHFGLWPQWKVSDGLAHIEVTAPSSLSGVKVNGEEVTATDGTTGELAVFPGAVTTSGAADSSLLEVGGDSLLTVGPGSGSAASANITVTLTSAGEKAVRQATLDALTSCVSEATDLTPADCPVSYSDYSWSPVTDVKWSISVEPEVDVQVDDETGDITVDGSFWAKVKYSYTDDSESDGPMKDTVSSTFSGTVDFSGGTPTVSFDESGY